jgi:UDP-N-acetylenolpyruvoylglucosamine reductase
MWQLIDGLALRGKTMNNIKIHETHPNIFINTGNATCADMERTILSIEELINVKYNIKCEREIECI